MIALYVYLFIGCVTGLLSGLFGIGGGIIIVPCLVWTFRYFHIAPTFYFQLATASSLASIICLTTTAAIMHYKQRTILWSVLYRLLPSMLLGTLIGTSVAKYLSTQLLGTCFGVLLLVAAYRMLVHTPHPLRALPGTRGLSVLGLWVGSQSGLLGIGGGSYLIPFLVRCNIPIHQAIGTSITACLPLAVVGTLALMITTQPTTHVLPWSTGYVYWPAVLGISASSMLCTPLCTYLATKINPGLLKRLFALLLLCISIHFLWSNVYP